MQLPFALILLHVLTWAGGLVTIAFVLWFSLRCTLNPFNTTTHSKPSTQTTTLSGTIISLGLATIFLILPLIFTLCTVRVQASPEMFNQRLLSAQTLTLSNSVWLLSCLMLCWLVQASAACKNFRHYLPELLGSFTGLI